jgi:hypothetical protein
MTETILFVFFLLFSVHSLFSFCLARPFPLFLSSTSPVQYPEYAHTLWLSGVFLVVSIIFDLHYIHPTVYVFLVQ